MNRVYLLLGSDLGDREQYLKSASGRLVEELLPDYLEVGELEEAVKCSSVYETEPWGFESETRFLNMAVMLQTELEPFQILKVCKEIERLVMAYQEKCNAMQIDLNNYSLDYIFKLLRFGSR